MDDLSTILQFKGRMNRQEWWIGAFLAVPFVVVGAAALATGITTVSPAIGAILFALIGIANIYVNVALNKARANDAGWNGWVQIVPILNLVVIGFFPSVPKKKAKKKKK